MKITVFYSWQSDLPNSTNRGFIAKALEKAIKGVTSALEIAQDDRPDEPDIGMDQDTQGMPGSPDIVYTIFDKIQNATIFVGDISIINKNLGPPTSQTTTYRLTPNPNVLIELGYAARHLRWDRIICVFNTDFGKVEELPFDLRPRRILSYHNPTTQVDPIKDLDHLASQLKNALQAIVNALDAEPENPEIALGPLIDELEHNLENTPNGSGTSPGGKFRTSFYDKIVHEVFFSALPSELKQKLRTAYSGCEEANGLITTVQNQQVNSEPWAVVINRTRDVRQRVRPLIEDALSALQRHLEPTIP